MPVNQNLPPVKGIRGKGCTADVALATIIEPLYYKSFFTAFYSFLILSGCNQKTILPEILALREDV
jgi:hypothetical protein